MKTRPEVILIQRIFPAYRKPVFDKISEKVQFVLLHSRNRSGIAQAQANYAKTISSLKYGKQETQVLLFPFLSVLRYRPKIVVLELAMGILNLPLIIFCCKLLNIKVAFWSHGYNRKTGFSPTTRKIDKYRLRLMKWVDASVVYSQFDKKILEDYLDSEKIFVAQNTLDTIALTSIRNKLDEEGKASVKQRLGITHKYNLTFIGRVIPSKKAEMLLEIYEQLLSQYNIRVGIHIIGDGEGLAVIKKAVEIKGYIEDFYFYGTVNDDKRSGELLYISDLMINPGYLGLNVNHAFCFDCPVLSFESKNGQPPHSPEVEYVINGQTGFLVEEHSVSAVVKVIADFLVDKKKKKTFTQNIRYAVVHVLPIEKMVNGFVECMDYLRSSKK